MNHLVADEMNKQNSPDWNFDQFFFLKKLCLLKKIFMQTKHPLPLTVYVCLMFS